MMHNFKDNMEESKKGTMTMVKGAIEKAKDASASMTTPQKAESTHEIKQRTYKEAREHSDSDAEAEFRAPTLGLEDVFFASMMYHQHYSNKVQS